MIRGTSIRCCPGIPVLLAFDTILKLKYIMNKDVTLTRNCIATLIPSGDEVTLEEGASYSIAQSLGGSVTLREAYTSPRPHPPPRNDGRLHLKSNDDDSRGTTHPT